MKKKYLLFLLFVLLFPSFVFAKTGEDLIYYVNQFENRYEAPSMMTEMINILGDLDLIEFDDETYRIYDKRNNKYMCTYDRNKHMLVTEEGIENSEDEFIFDVEEYCNNNDDETCEYFLDLFDRIIYDFSTKDFEPTDTIVVEFRHFYDLYFKSSELSYLLYEYVIHEGNDILDAESSKNACHWKQIYLKSKSGKHLMTLRETGIEEKGFILQDDVSELDNITLPISDELKEMYESYLGFPLPENYKYIKIVFVKESPNDIFIKSMKEKETSKNGSMLSKTSRFNSTINTNVSLLKEGDYVTYEVVLHNKSNNDLNIDLSNIVGEYIDYIVEYPNGKKIKANGEQTIYLKVLLKKDPEDAMIIDGSFIDSSNAKMLFSKTLENPKTYRNILIVLLLIVLLAVTLKSKKNKLALSVLAITVSLIGFMIPVKADDTSFININSKVNISNNLTYKGTDIESQKYLNRIYDEALSEIYNIKNFPDSKICDNSNRIFAHFDAEQIDTDKYKLTLKNFPSKESSLDVVLNISKGIDQATNRNKFVIEECRGNDDLYTKDFLEEYAYNRKRLTDSTKINEYINDLVCPEFSRRYLESPNSYDEIQLFLEQITTG